MRCVSSLGTGKNVASGAVGLLTPELIERDENESVDLEVNVEPNGVDRRERPTFRRGNRLEMSDVVCVRPSSLSLSTLLAPETRFLRSAACQCAAWRT